MAEVMDFYDGTSLEQVPIPPPIPGAKEVGSLKKVSIFILTSGTFYSIFHSQRSVWIQEQRGIPGKERVHFN